MLKYLIALLLVSACGSPEAYTGYITYCGTPTAFTMQTHQLGVLQPTTAFVKVCGGTSSLAGGAIAYRSVSQPTCGLSTSTTLAPVAEVTLSNDWTPCP